MTRLVLGVAKRVSEIAAAADSGMLEEFDALLDTAWSLGLRTIDISTTYAGGDGPRILAQALARTSAPFAVCLKLPCLPEEESDRMVARQAALFDDRCAAILLKDPRNADVMSGRVEAGIARLRTRNPTAKVGVASPDHDVAREVRRGTSAMLMQTSASFVSFRSFENAIGDDAATDMEIWTFGSLMSGLATALAADARGPSGVRGAVSPAALEAFSHVEHAFRSAFPAAIARAPLERLCIGFALSHPRVAQVIVAPRTVSQLEDCMAAERLAGDHAFRRAMEQYRRFMAPSREGAASAA